MHEQFAVTATELDQLEFRLRLLATKAQATRKSTRRSAIRAADALRCLSVDMDHDAECARAFLPSQLACDWWEAANAVGEEKTK